MLYSYSLKILTIICCTTLGGKKQTNKTQKNISPNGCLRWLLHPPELAKHAHTLLKLRILETDSEINKIFARSQLTTNRKPSATCNGHTDGKKKTRKKTREKSGLVDFLFFLIIIKRQSLNCGTHPEQKVPEVIMRNDGRLTGGISEGAA